MNDLDLLLRLSLIAALYDTNREVFPRVKALLPLVPRARRQGLFTILSAKDPLSVIRQLCIVWESEDGA